MPGRILVVESGCLKRWSRVRLTEIKDSGEESPNMNDCPHRHERLRLECGEGP